MFRSATATIWAATFLCSCSSPDGPALFEAGGAHAPGNPERANTPLSEMVRTSSDIYVVSIEHIEPSPAVSRDGIRRHYVMGRVQEVLKGRPVRDGLLAFAYPVCWDGQRPTSAPLLPFESRSEVIVFVDGQDGAFQFRGRQDLRPVRRLTDAWLGVTTCDPGLRQTIRDQCS
jgi:hypothetical protein